MHYEHLIGFDARENWLDVAAMWPEKRRHEFLLRPDAEKPLAIDQIVWPSVFDLDAAQPGADSWAAVSPGAVYASTPRAAWCDDGAWEHYFGDHLPLQRPLWVGYRGHLWSDLERMREHLNDAWGDLWKPCVLIAISEMIHASDAEALDTRRAYTIMPEDPQPEWRLLGFDVGDYGGTSFLANAGYTPEEKGPLVERWAPHLNRWHLFLDWEKAVEYTNVAYARDAVHAPFSVYGIYLVEAIEMPQ